MLTLDTREASLAKELDMLNVQYTLTPLDIGDIAIGDTDGVPKLLVERKTMSDLYSSIIDGRYTSQHQRLMEYKEVHPDTKIVYLLETADYKKLTKQQKNAIRGVLENTVLRNIFQVIASYDVVLTATIVKSLIAKVCDPKVASKVAASSASSSLTSGSYRPSSKVSILANQLAAIPSIGATIADHLGKEYRSMGQFMMYLQESTNVKQFGDLKVNGRRIGQSKSQAIYDALFGKQDDDQTTLVNKTE